ncbi:MAG: radical SAM protein [Candidatus Hodarchaeales archaeon]
MHRKSKKSFHEINTYHKHLRSVDLRIGLIFPNKYRLGMANLAVKILYDMWNSVYERVYVERFFLPENQWEIPRSIETGSSFKSFDVLAVTIQFELDYINFLRMLSQGGIPLYRKERNIDQNPLVIAGGPAVTANPLPLSDFVDLIIQGEVEPLSNILLDHLFERSLSGIQSLNGIYLPDNPPSQSIYSRIIDYDKSYVPISQVRNTSDKNWKESQILGGYLLQISRGCNRGCKFCLIGRLTRPMRERSRETLEKVSIEGTKATQVNHITLIGSGVGDYSRLAEYLHFLNEKKIKFSIPSIRADSNTEILQEIVNSGQKTITIAPETGGEEFRFKIGKRITNDQFYNYVNTAHEKGIKHLKLYLILGLPGQNMEEINKTIEFCLFINRWFKKRDLNLTIGYFIPKRQTAFHDFNITTNHVKLMEDMSKRVKRELKNTASLHISPIKWGIIQTILSLGDQSLAPYLVKLCKTQGRYVDWIKILGSKPLTFLEELQKKEDLEIPLPLK